MRRLLTVAAMSSLCLLASGVLAPATAQSNDVPASPTAAATQTQILSFTSQHAGMMLSSDPESVRILSRLSTSSLFGEDESDATGVKPPQSVSFSEKGQDENGNFSFSTSLAQLSRTNATSGLDVWTQAYANLFGSRSGVSQNDGNFLVADLGVDYITTPSFLFGSLVQVDSMSQATLVYPAGLQAQGAGEGWMAGPYLGLHVLPHLFVDARLAVGDSGNHTDPVANYEDGFSTVSGLSEVRITGGWSFGDLHFDPSSRATFYEGRQNSFVDSSAAFIPAQRLTMAQTAFGPKVSYAFNSYPGVLIEPALSVNALWNFQQDRSTVETVPEMQGNLYAETEFSAQIKTAAGVSLKCSIGYDGIGTDTSHDLKGLMAINLPLPD